MLMNKGTNCKADDTRIAVFQVVSRKQGADKQIDICALSEWKKLATDSVLVWEKDLLSSDTITLPV